MANASKICIIIITAIVVSALSSVSFSEINGTINSSSSGNATILTGLYGYTVNACTSNNTCFSYKCFFDYDTSGTRTTSSGLCNATSSATCIHDDSSSSFSVTAGGSNICTSNTTYRTCSSGSWSSESSCSSGQTCSLGICSTPSPGSSGSPGSSSQNTTTTTTASISIMLNQSSVDITQGKSGRVSATVKNTGGKSLSSLVLSVSGINNSWISIDPSSISLLGTGSSRSFNISIFPPVSADINIYDATVSAATNETNGRNSTKLTLRILPTSNTTVLINQTYQEYSALIGTLDYNITDLEKRNASLGDVDDLKAILESIKNKINQSKTYIDNGDYVNAKIVLDQAKNLMGQFSAKADSVGFREIAVQVSNPLDITIIVIVVVIVAIIAVVIYLFWPSAKEKQIMLKYEFKRKR